MTGSEPQSSLFFALLATFAILGMLAAVLSALWRLRAMGQREAEQGRERAALTAAYAELAAARAAAERRATQLAATLSAMDDGVLMTDADLRLLQWNSRWTTLLDIPPGLLAVGAPFEELLRFQARSGEFGTQDVEAEVARRVARIRAIDIAEDVERTRPDGRVIRLRRRRLPDGSLVSVVTDVTRLRRPVAEDAPRPAAAPRQRGAVPPRRRCAVLLVEDIVVNQMVSATQLRRAGHRVEIASSGAEALERIHAAPFDIVLMDLMMPGMSGLEAAAAIRRLPGFIGRVPILALTATARATDRARCVEAGMQGMLTKPIRAEEILDAIAAALAPGAVRLPPPAPPAAPPPPAPRALLDLERLAELRNGLPGGLFEQLARECILEMQTRMRDLREAIALPEPERIGAAAHALAGMAGGYAMAAVERRMRRLMDAAASPEACRAAAEGMEEELRQTEAALAAPA